MEFLNGNGFLAIIGCLSLFALTYVARALLGYRNVRQDAREDFAYKRENVMIDPDTPEQLYVKAYTRAHGPRHVKYMAGAMTAILVLTWPMLRIFQYALDLLWHLNGRSDVFQPGFLVWKFMLFFGIIAFWVFIMYMAARFYHARTPRSFEQEFVNALKDNSLT